MFPIIIFVKYKEKQFYPFRQDKRGIKPHLLGSIYKEMLQPLSYKKKTFLIQGKSLSIICSSLTWLNDYEKKQRAELETELTSLDKEEEEETQDWFTVQTNKKAKKHEMKDQEEMLTRLKRKEERIKHIKEGRRLKKVKYYSSFIF